MVWVYYKALDLAEDVYEVEAGFTRNVGVASTTGGGGRVEARGS